MNRRAFTIIDTATGEVRARKISASTPELRDIGTAVAELAVPRKYTRIKFDSIDGSGKVVNPRLDSASIVNPKPKLPPVIPPEERMVQIKQKDWDAFDARIAAIEAKLP